MGPFGKNTHNGGNIRNVPVCVILYGPAYTFHESPPLGETSEKSTFVNNLGKIRRK